MDEASVAPASRLASLVGVVGTASNLIGERVPVPWIAGLADLLFPPLAGGLSLKLEAMEYRLSQEIPPAIPLRHSPGANGRPWEFRLGTPQEILGSVGVQGRH